MLKYSLISNMQSVKHNHRHPDLHQLIQLAHHIRGRIDTAMGTACQIDFPAKVPAPVGIVDSHIAHHRHPVFHRSGIAFTSQGTVSLLVIDIVDSLRSVPSASGIASDSFHP